MARHEHPPAFLFYVDDFVSDGAVEAMSTEQVGAYVRLLCKAWRENPVGTIPDDDEVLARWARLSPAAWQKSRGRVLAAFHLQNERWHQKRMKAEYVKLMAEERKRSAAGRRGATARWTPQEPENSCDGNATALRQGCDDPCDDDAIPHATSMAKNANQISKSNRNQIDGQTEVSTLLGESLDPKSVADSDWIELTAEFLRRLPPGSEDRRLAAQVAWLVCAGAPFLPAANDALDGMKVLAGDGKPQKNPVAYWRRCLEKSLGAERFAAAIERAPSRANCARIMEAV